MEEGELPATPGKSSLTPAGIHHLTDESEEPASIYDKFVLSDEMITNMVVAHETQMERLASGKYLVATAQTLGLASQTPGNPMNDLKSPNDTGSNSKRNN